MRHCHLLQLNTESLNFPLKCLFLFFDQLFRDISWLRIKVENREALIFELFDSKIFSLLLVILILLYMLYHHLVDLGLIILFIIFCISYGLSLFCLTSQYSFTETAVSKVEISLLEPIKELLYLL
jgi:predicted permease